MEKPQGLVVAIGAKPKEAESSDPEKETMDSQEKKTAVARNVLKAVEAKNAEKLSEALEAFVGACGDSESDSPTS